MTFTMTTYNDDGKTSLSRPPDLEGTEEIRPWAYWYAHGTSLDGTGGVLKSILRVTSQKGLTAVR